MTKELNKRAFSFIFLFIFFVKMVIAVAPLIAITIDSKSVYAVIMQLEIETSNSSDKAKETVKEYFNSCISAKLDASAVLLQITPATPENAVHFTAFYPSVPTPPPNV